MTEMTCHVHHVFLLSGNDVISLKSRPLIFVYLFTCTQSIQKQIAKYDIKSKYMYPEEYSTIDKASKTYEYLNLQLIVLNCLS